MLNCNCCSCEFASDYGTTDIEEVSESVFSISKVDGGVYVRPAARVRRTTNQSITPSGTFTVISFDAEILDSGNLWDAGSPTVFTITEPGIYVFGGCGLWAANATGTRELAIRRNGSQVIQVKDQPAEPTYGGTVTPWSHITYQYRLLPGDTLELLARQESGGALNMLAEADDSIVFWIFYAGRTI